MVVVDTLTCELVFAASFQSMEAAEASARTELPKLRQELEINMVRTPRLFGCPVAFTFVWLSGAQAAVRGGNAVGFQLHAVREGTSGAPEHSR